MNSRNENMMLEILKNTDEVTIIMCFVSLKINAFTRYFDILGIESCQKVQKVYPLLIRFLEVRLRIWICFLPSLLEPLMKLGCLPFCLYISKPKLHLPLNSIGYSLEQIHPYTPVPCRKHKNIWHFKILVISHCFVNIGIHLQKMMMHMLFNNMHAVGEKILYNEI